MSAAAQTGPVVVVNLTDTPDDLHRAITALDRRIPGVLVIAAHPAAGGRRPRLADLSSDLLDAMGHIGTRADRRRLEADLQRPTAFLATSTVTDLLVTDVQMLLPDGLEELTLMAGLCAVRLWLLVDHPDADVVSYLTASYAPPWTSAAHFEQHWAARLGQPAAVPLPAPPWPLIDPASSLNALHLALSAQHTTQALPSLDRYCDPVRATFTSAAAGRAVVDLFDAALLLCECTIRASCLRPLAEHAWHAHYLSLGDWHRWRARRPTAEPADLHPYRDTARPAATVLDRLGLTGVQMTSLRMRDVTTDGASVHCGNHTWLPVPAELQLILRRQHLASAGCGVGPDGPFLTLMGTIVENASNLVV